MLSVTSSAEPSLLTNSSLPVPLTGPSFTSIAAADIQQMSAVGQLQPSTTVEPHSQQLLTEHSVTVCDQHKVPQKSRAVCDQHKVPQKSRAIVYVSCSSSASGAKVPRKEANVCKPSTQVGRKAASVSGRMTSAHRVILPAAAAAASSSCHSNVSTASSSVDAKARLRAVILGGRKCQQPQNGNFTVCVCYLFVCSYNMLLMCDHENFRTWWCYMYHWWARWVILHSVTGDSKFLVCCRFIIYLPPVL